jgi:hypothetical protein
MCHERSINSALNHHLIAPRGQLNTTNCRTDATFLSLTLLISLINHQKWAYDIGRVRMANDFKTSRNATCRATNWFRA